MISLLTIGSRGDLQPFLALGIGLKNAGYPVRLVTAERYRPYAEQYHLDFVGLSADPLELLQSADGQAWLKSDNNPLALITNLIKLGKPTFQQMLAEIETALAGSELILYSLFGSLAFNLAEKWQIPAIMVNLQPIMGQTSEFPAAGSPLLNLAIPILTRSYNRFSYKFVEQVMWQPFRAIVQKWRVEHLNLPKENFWGPYRKLDQHKTLTLHAYSPTVVPRPADWPTHHQTTGYWFLPPPQNWQAPADLVKFLAAGMAPVYIGFGSMVDGEPEQLANLIVNAVKQSNVRCVLSAGWANLEANDLPDSIFLLSDDIPHDWLFEQVAGVVHHGGAGTTAAGLRAGKPSFVVPYFADQHFWGGRVYALGAGPRPVRRQKLTVNLLAVGLHGLVNNRQMRENATFIGQKIQLENGVEQAINYLKTTVLR
ncbi:MAG: sterol 3beta-glucosyltransferase [Cellvibrionaceae bacterium]|jgi:sterol 3beta-glucosyltransferase